MTSIRSAWAVAAFALLPACATNKTGSTLEVTTPETMARHARASSASEKR